jgi:hypothetical protein
MNVAVLKESEGVSVSTPATAAGTGTYEVALGYLRAFVTVLVVLHHSVLAYSGFPASKTFIGGGMSWRAFPIVDAAHPWSLASIISGFNDVYFMALMFLLSGLFVQQSIEKKGVVAFLKDRVLRLGIPFLFSAFIVTPIAYYFAYLQLGGAPGLMNFWSTFQQVGYWPTGPAWFILMLLAFDVVVTLFYAIAPRWGHWVGKLNARAKERPGRFFLLFAVLSLIVYAPMSHISGDPGSWTYWGLFQFQTSRIFNYFLYFAFGIGTGAYGIKNGLLAPDGRLAQRWWLWMFVYLPLIFIAGIAVFLTILSTKDEATRKTIIDFASLTFTLNCGIASFAWLATFTRFVHRANRLMDSLSANAYGIYIVHYAFVAGLQFALLPQNIPGVGKAMIVTFGALLLSWMTAMILRRVPVASKLMGE